MKLFRSIFFGVVITLLGTMASAQELTLPADPQPASVDFAHRTLVLQYTGTGCPYCINMIKPIDALLNDNNYNDLFHVAVCHRFNEDDPMYLNPDNVSQLCPNGGYPRALVGFTEQTATAGDIRTTLIRQIAACLSREVKAGIAVNSKLEGNTLTVKAQLKAVTEGKFTIGCWLLEDDITAYQSSMGTITHNNAIRVADKAYGNEVGTVKAGETADTDFTITLKEGWKKENCHLLVFACVHSDYTSAGMRYDAKYIITNVITAPLNTAVPYEYLSNSAIDEVEVNNEIQIIALGDQVEVTATSPIEDVAVYNMQGRLMQQLSPSAKSISFSLDNLPAGVYMVRVQNAMGIKTEKIIKQ